jgi:hypothetical protein
MPNRKLLGKTALVGPRLQQRDCAHQRGTNSQCGGNRALSEPNLHSLNPSPAIDLARWRCRSAAHVLTANSAPSSSRPNITAARHYLLRKTPHPYCRSDET